MKRKRPHPKDEANEPSSADPEVVAATQDVLALLQMYGPLSYIQLKVNIETQFEGEEDNSLSVKTLQKVLDVLVELGVIHIMEGAAAAGEDSKPDTTNNNPVYSFGSGTRRMDALLPQNTLDEIHETGNELHETQQRIQLLQSFLQTQKSTSAKAAQNNIMTPSGTISNPAPLTQEFARHALNQMIEQHPDVVHDPTYSAALRLFKVYDVTKNSKTASGAEGANSGSKKRKRKSIDSSAVDAIAESGKGNESPLIVSKKSES